MASSEAQKRASMNYNAKMVHHQNIALNKGTDADIIRHLESMTNKQGYIKALIRADMAKQGKE